MGWFKVWDCWQLLLLLSTFFLFFGWTADSSFWEPVLEYYFFKTRNVVCTDLKNLCDLFWRKTLITAVGLGKITYDFDSVSNGNCRTLNLEFFTVIFCISNIPQGSLEHFLSLWDTWWINIDNTNCCKYRNYAFSFNEVNRWVYFSILITVWEACGCLFGWNITSLWVFNQI